MLRQILALVTFLLLSTTPPYDALKSEAERFYAEKSYARAHEIYEQASKLSLPDEERRWVELRLADTAWRAGENNRDAGPLQEIIRKSGENHDRVWAEANESLGDLTQSIGYYLAALDYWAGSDEIELARQRYLAIVWRIVEQPYRGMQLPREVLVNAIAIAQSPKDVVRARYLLAQQLMNQGDAVSVERAFEHLEAIIAAGKTTEWYDDALYLAAYNYAAGRSLIFVNGEPGKQTHFMRALELYRKLVNEFAKGESRYRDDAERAIADITAPSVNLGVAGTFLPDSEQEAHLTWRNTRRVALALIPVDLTAFQVRKNGNWMDGLPTAAKPVRSWTFETSDKGDHVPGFERIVLTPRLEPGAYMMTASADGKSAKQLLLVTDAHVLLHASPKQLQVFVSSVLTGEPIAGARVRVWQQQNEEGVIEDVITNAEGLALVKKIQNYGSVTITAAAGKGRQAWHSTYAYSYGSADEREAWSIYAFTDRPAYRPGETVQWKIIARTRSEDVWATPSGQRIAYEITSPRGEKVASGEAKLNAFGSFWASLPLTESMPLGEYRVDFKVLGKEDELGQATLFRLEEYKLPEFLVRVSTAEKKLYRLGETIEATIEAEYYFGGPVANATVEAVIYREPFYRYWFPWRKYPWYYEDNSNRSTENVFRRETLKTDANGRAVVRIETTADGNDTRFRIEARVVDASRREVRGEGKVAVTRQRYSVIAHPEHYLIQPGDPVDIELKALDANDQPVQTTGRVKVIRREWRHKERVYADEEMLETSVTTNASGEATFTFTPRREGYYTVRWTSEDRDPKQPLRARDIVTTETSVWVADRSTRDVGYLASGLEVIVDKDTLRAGETAAVMVVSPMSGRWVVLNTAGSDILDTQVLHLDGTAKLVRIPIDSRHSPNFSVTATSVLNREIATDTERVVVPPVEHFIDVEVKSDREQYQPREEGTVTVTTRDADGKPVAAEVALSISDEAVTAIQKDPAGDPRQFFFGDTRPEVLVVSGSLHAQQYVRLVPGKMKDQLIDDRYMERDGVESGVEAGVKGGVIGGVVGGIPGGVADQTVMRSVAPAPPPPSMASPVAQAEMITVTSQAAIGDARKAGNGQGVDVQVRSDFRSTAFWQPDVVTDASGVAKVKFKYPEALTTWRAIARAATAGTQFGMGSSSAKTNMPLIVRLQSPRFFVAGDRSTVSAVINNNTDEAMRVEPKLEVEGLTLNMTTNSPLTVPAHGEARYDWSVVADRPGQAKLRVSGRGAQYGDAMERAFTVYEHGIDKLIARSGKMRGSEATVRLDLPRERRATDLVVQVAPSLAVTMLDALPYLVDYPYGCTEQTMSRFLPAAIVAKTLNAMGLDARKRIPKLDDVTKASIARLYDFQHEDEGWGWWKEGESDAFMTAYVVWGFAIARDAGMKIDQERIENGSDWLDDHLSEYADDWNQQAWMLHAMSAWDKAPSTASTKAFDNVWAHRDRLTSYSRALLALAAHRYGMNERTAVLVRNLENGAKLDRDTSTAESMSTVHWGEDRFWWRWHDGPVETTAFVLQALVTIDPKHKYVEPAMNWLVKNRRGAQWSNTRDTAITVLALNDYLRASGETVRDVDYEVSVNGKVIATKSIKAKDILDAPSRFSVDPSIVNETSQEIHIRASAPLYFSAEARFVSLEEPVKAAGNELFVKREYFRLAPKPTLLKGVTYDRIQLRDGDSIVSGERVEVVATIETKNDYEYLLFEDLKPAGFEAVELQSGDSLVATNKEQQMQWIYQELRDRKVAMFANKLTQGTWEIRYTLRAETPGSFHALPLLGQAMYVPEVRANSEEIRVVVKESEVH
jgi:uncharacterized protein YfaS (alpha-2-macroglobulin family)